MKASYKLCLSGKLPTYNILMVVPYELYKEMRLLKCTIFMYTFVPGFVTEMNIVLDTNYDLSILCTYLLPLSVILHSL